MEFKAMRRESVRVFGRFDLRPHTARQNRDLSPRPGHQIAPVSCILSTNRSAESRTLMSDLDVAKEEIAYLKVWLGILVVTDISTFGWLISNVAEAITLLLWAAVIAVAVLSGGIFLLHRLIMRQLQSL